MKDFLLMRNSVVFILPSLAKKGPILVAKYITDFLFERNIPVIVYYFDSIEEVLFKCECKKIRFFDKIPTSNVIAVHSHGLRPDFYCFLHFLRKKNIRLITTMHNYMVDDLGFIYGKVKASIISFFWLKALRVFDVVVTLSNLMRVYYQPHIAFKKLEVVYNSVPKPIMNVLNDDISYFDQNLTVVGVVAQLVKRKGIHQIIEAISLDDTFGLLIIGDGPEREGLEKQVIDLGIKERVKFLGFRLNPYDFFENVDIFCISSFSEGFPLSVLEAGQLKLPVVASKLEIFLEIFPNELIYFELNDSNSLIHALQFARDNSHHYASLLEHKIAANYSLDSMGRSYLNLYNLK